MSRGEHRRVEQLFARVRLDNNAVWRLGYWRYFRIESYIRAFIRQIFCDIGYNSLKNIRAYMRSCAV